MSKVPTIEVLVGIPGSGKSTYAKDFNGKVHSSDTLREELFADVNFQGGNQELFVELHKRIKSDLVNGFDVCYDATNIDKKRRIAFLGELKNISCYKKCVVFITPYDICLEQNAGRERQVPEEVIKSMYMRWCPPHYHEGFDEIEIIYNYGDEVNRMKYSAQYLFDGDSGLDTIDQENSHHTLTIGRHCKAAAKYTQAKWPHKTLLNIAALLHDIGKPVTKTRINSRGEDDGECHYYQHQCCGAYDSILCTEVMGLDTEWQLYVANLIYFHMHPYMSWKQSDKAMRKDRRRIGETMFNDIMHLNEADRWVH